MLKYETAAKIGDRIRGYDFDGRTDCYVEGRVKCISERDGYRAFVITVDTDVWRGKTMTSRVGRTVNVPMETTWDYDGRIINLGK